MQSERKSFVFYFDWLESCAYLSDEEFGQLTRAIVQYAKTGAADGFKLSEHCVIAFNFMRGQLDRDREKYARRCEASRKNGKKGGRPKKAREVDPLADEQLNTE